MSNYLLISDAAKEVKVETHVLRYWEEELHLPIKRNELGHRYYTEEDVERFKQIKGMKERGLQLKAIKMILKDGKLDVLPQEEGTGVMDPGSDHALGNDATDNSADHNAVDMPRESREEKAKRLQWILQQMISQAVQENNRELARDIKESVLKELDYQFRMQEEREEERARAQAERTEVYYQKVDELLRKKSRGRKEKNKDLPTLDKNEKKTAAKEKSPFFAKQEKMEKRKNLQSKKRGHFLL